MARKRFMFGRIVVTVGDIGPDPRGEGWGYKAAVRGAGASWSEEFWYPVPGEYAVVASDAVGQLYDAHFYPQEYVSDGTEGLTGARKKEEASRARAFVKKAARFDGDDLIVAGMESGSRNA